MKSGARHEGLPMVARMAGVGVIKVALQSSETHTAEMNILVTGGAGFIGSHLCEKLLALRHSVVAVDNFDPFYSHAQKIANISRLEKYKLFKFIKADVRSNRGMQAIFVESPIDSVFHLAGRGGIPHSTKHPFLYLEEIMKGTMTILQLAEKHGVKRVINASSSSVYTTKDDEKAEESASTDSPHSIYAALKKSSELLCHAYHHLYGFGVINCRFFSVYGPGGRPDQIIFKVVRMIMTGEPIPIIEPEPKRDFTFVTDIVNGLILTLKLPPTSYHTMNFGSGSPRTITDVIRCAEDSLKIKAVIGATLQAERSDMTVTNAAFSYANRLLGWKPEYTLETGMPEFIKWYLLKHRG